MAKAPRRTIAQVSRMLRSIVEAETLEHYFWVDGRIERFYRSDRGNVFFDLVDERARIRCFLSESRAGDVPFGLRNQLEVSVRGDVHFYEEQAEAQINVVEVRLAEQRAEARPALDQLRAEGLYPPTPKPPPREIRRIGVITSRGSRAIGDFETAYQTAGERQVLAPLTWQYVVLEGERAPQSIVDGINGLERNPEADIIAIVRGGGRQRSLATFDHVDVLRAISRCDKFIVTGIGHHRDRTLADELADYVASTPTAAANYLGGLCIAASKPAPGSASSEQPMSPPAIRLLAILLGAVSLVALALLVYSVLSTQ